MCFHSERDFDRWRAITHAPSHAAQVVMRHSTPASRFGEFAEGFPVDARNAKEVANVINELRTWHPGGDKVVDLKHVNEVREKLGLPFLDADGLPLPSREPRPSDDVMAVRLAAADTTRALNILLTSSEKTRRDLGNAADERKRAAAQARFRERVALADSLGLTVEELNAQEALVAEPATVR